MPKSDKPEIAHSEDSAFLENVERLHGRFMEAMGNEEHFTAIVSMCVLLGQVATENCTSLERVKELVTSSYNEQLEKNLSKKNDN